ncbi:1-deoxy-D-xylulose-5-phosphate reductoisomerase [Xylophilus ampelinus]|uniref:1-deoxy-D-xylulose 5-phosphate reductoisomerase n=1 Tax=Xylophilus ampelinus TaxID=54067 RepID=A0A318SF83_9BURK|nr:1-deoxy-D-xylulose-5-phosphate reductoisomerase [Xylophilus ampelinus]MCS4510825.1 1-deoxy-D-xylulose-5-phosphate reductoisomerase [Xylophilus ampelinus]PYE76196.1 1-deoxy-D-xylulose 5-phosphate reductoisomerase [Xylophilus ampelinus]
MQTITVLGSTGSIGLSTLDVLARHPDRFEVFALAAATQVDAMLQQCRRLRPRYAVMAQTEAATRLRQECNANGLAVEVLQGHNAMEMIAAHPDVDMVMAAIVGAAGLAPCLAAARAGKRLLLANKEALVVGGEWFMDAVRDGGAQLLPIDSEHSAIFQSLPDDPTTWERRVDRLVLTASGGPFRTRDPSTLSAVTPDEACAHPNWSMGRKISVDSATMMNKGLEVIEACYLFGLPPGRIEVVIHPQSTVHSLVQYHDGSLVAQLGVPDMRVPIAYGLSWPERMESGAPRLDFSSLAAMTFERPDPQRFPGLQLAWDALRAPPGTTAVLNAANEVAVQAFLDGRIRFDQIHAVNLATLERCVPRVPTCLGDLMAIDAQARSNASAAVVGRMH